MNHLMMTGMRNKCVTLLAVFLILNGCGIFKNKSRTPEEKFNSIELVDSIEQPLPVKSAFTAEDLYKSREIALKKRKRSQTNKKVSHKNVSQDVVDSDNQAETKNNTVILRVKDELGEVVYKQKLN